MSEYKECPYCAEQILARAVKCKHCRSALEQSAPQGRERGTQGGPPPPLRQTAFPPQGEAGLRKGGPPPPPPDSTNETGPGKTVPPPPPPAAPTPAAPGVKAAKPGWVVPVLAVMLIVFLAGAGFAVFKVVQFFADRETPLPIVDPPVVSEENHDIADAPAGEEQPDAPDLAVLPNAVNEWLTGIRGDDAFLLLYEDAVPDIDEYDEIYGEDDTVLVFKFESIGETDVTILLGIPHGEAFYRLTLEWRAGAWAVTEEEDLW